MTGAAINVPRLLPVPSRGAERWPPPPEVCHWPNCDSRRSERMEEAHHRTCVCGAVYNRPESMAPNASCAQSKRNLPSQITPLP